MNKTGDAEDLYQIALLIDQLKHDDVQFRVSASRSLTLIGRGRYVIFCFSPYIYYIYLLNFLTN